MRSCALAKCVGLGWPARAARLPGVLPRMHADACPPLTRCFFPVCAHCVLRPPQNGRIKGDGKKALRAVIEKYGIPVTITANQNLILREVEPAWKEDIMATLAAGGLKDASEWDSIER